MRSHGGIFKTIVLVEGQRTLDILYFLWSLPSIPVKSRGEKGVAKEFRENRRSTETYKRKYWSNRERKVYVCIAVRDGVSGRGG